MAVSVSAAVVGFTSTAITVGTRGIAADLGLSLDSLGWVVNGFLVIVLQDFNGLWDIKAGITLSVNGYSVPFGALLPYFQFTSLSPTKVEMTSLGPIPPGLFPAVLRVGLRDTSGLRGGDGVTLQ